MINLVLNGKEYTLATNLRVAYNVQGQHNHKSYMEVFQNIDNMTLEEQVGILYEAAKIGTDKSIMPNKQDFLAEYLDAPEANISALLKTLKQIFEGILGRKIELAEDSSEAKTDPEGE